MAFINNPQPLGSGGRKIIFYCISDTPAMGLRRDKPALLPDRLYNFRHSVGRRREETGELSGEHRQIIQMIPDCEYHIAA